mgnify:CR=1 FL=1
MNEITCPHCSGTNVFLIEKADNKYWLEYDEDDDGLTIGALEETAPGAERYILCEDCGEEIGWYELEDHMAGE